MSTETTAKLCPVHGASPQHYEDEGVTYCTVLLPDAIDTGDICGERMHDMEEVHQFTIRENQ